MCGGDSHGSFVGFEAGYRKSRRHSRSSIDFIRHYGGGWIRGQPPV